MANHPADNSPDHNGRRPIPQTKRICHPPSAEYRAMVIDDADPVTLLNALTHVLDASITGCPNTNGHKTHLHLWEQDQGHGLLLEMHCPTCQHSWKL